MVVILGSIPRTLQRLVFILLFGSAVWLFQIALLFYTTNVKLIKVDNIVHLQKTIQ